LYPLLTHLVVIFYLFIYGYKVAVNCKFIKRDARRDSDSYGKCDMRKAVAAIIILVSLLRELAYAAACVHNRYSAAVADEKAVVGRLS